MTARIIDMSPSGLASIARTWITHKDDTDPYEWGDIAVEGALIETGYMTPDEAIVVIDAETDDTVTVVLESGRALEINATTGVVTQIEG